MVERQHRPALNLYVPGGLVPRAAVDLPDAAAHHARVRRADAGDPVILTDGKGTRAAGVIDATGKSRVSVVVESLTQVPPPAPVHLLVPVADRDRMLLAAEKCTELQVTSWRPVRWARSRSVSPRGEGDRFREKVTARMVAALEQSGGAWLPDIWPESEPAEALQSAQDIAERFILDASGLAIRAMPATHAVALAVGPEGGFEEDEVALATSLGWVRMALGASTLRFETALIVAVAVVRAQQHTHRS